MYNNYYFIKKLAGDLKPKLHQAVLQEAFSQNKDELVLSFKQTDNSLFFIKANLSNVFACLSFPAEYARSKRNSANVFKEIMGLPVLDVRFFLNERAFYLCFGKYRLVFKLFGRFANAILCEGENPIAVFNAHFQEDWDKQFSAYHKDIDQTLEAYLNQGFDVTFPTLRGEVEAFLHQQGVFALSPEKQYHEIANLLQVLDLGKIQVGFTVNKQWKLSLLAIDANDKHEFDDAVLALHFFYNQYAAVFSVSFHKKQVQNRLQGLLRKTEKTIVLQKERLELLQTKVPDKEIADILMANLHQVGQLCDSVELFDFYRNQPIVIALKKDISPQKNAERYYKKAKKAHLEIAKLEENIAKAAVKREEFLKQLACVTKVKSYKELKPFLPQHIEKEQEFPFKVFGKEGFEIWVGRNAKNNDLLTLKYAHKNDLWLHAKEVSGSHVVIKEQAGKNFPKTVIEYAATIAAGYSKRKTDSLCPVTFTPKKYVRKIKGSPAGAVFVEKEQVILVKPLVI